MGSPTHRLPIAESRSRIFAKRNERRDRIAARLEAQRKRSIERVVQLRRAYKLRHGS